MCFASLPEAVLQKPEKHTPAAILWLHQHTAVYSARSMTLLSAALIENAAQGSTQGAERHGCGCWQDNLEHVSVSLAQLPLCGGSRYYSMKAHKHGTLFWRVWQSCA